MQSPQLDSACHIVAMARRPIWAAAAILFSVAALGANALAQDAARSPDQIKAATSAVDSAFIKSNTATSKD
jgi:hypothetical protein